MKMGLPNVKQDVGTSVCGPVCLLNIYSYFGIKTTLDKILSDLKTDKNQVTYTPQLAQHLLKNNSIDFSIFYFNTVFSFQHFVESSLLCRTYLQVP